MQIHAEDFSLKPLKMYIVPGLAAYEKEMFLDAQKASQRFCVCRQIPC